MKYSLVLWRSSNKSDLLHRIERLHCRAARIIFNLPKDMPSSTVLEYDHWDTIDFYHKIEVVKLFYKGYNNYLPEILSKSICS